MDNSALVHEENVQASETVKKTVFAGVFAAITYVVFTFLSIPITIPGGMVSVHLGNAFVALGALILGSLFGGIGGAIGLTIGDLFNPAYLPQAPITFIIKFLIGLIVGTIAHRFGHITTETDNRKVLTWTIIAVSAGMIFNAIGDPGLRYYYKILILGKSAAEVSFAINFVVTLINSVVSLIVTTVLYMALRIPLKKAGLFFNL